MKAYQNDMIALSLQAGALKFGEFTLKSGRKSPYFFNAGQFNTGGQLAKLGHIYAAAYQAHKIEADALFGPAYKGIPLVTALGGALYSEHNIDLPCAYNRKEVKTHGEGGTIVGASLSGRVVVIDDVITAGTAIREALDMIDQAGATPAAVIVALDRQEQGAGEQSAIAELAREYALPVYPVITLADIVEYVQRSPELARWQDAIRDYQDRYGVIS